MGDKRAIGTVLEYTRKKPKYLYINDRSSATCDIGWIRRGELFVVSRSYGNYVNLLSMLGVEYTMVCHGKSWNSMKVVG